MNTKHFNLKTVPGKRKKTFSWLFWTSIVLVHLVFFFVFCYNNNIYMADSKEYLQQAYNIKNNFSFYCADMTKQINPAFYTKRPPIYGLMILTLKSIYNSNYFILFVQNLFCILNIVGLLRILKEYGFNFEVRKTLFVFLLFYPSLYIYNNMIMAESLLQTLIFWGFYNLFYYLKKKNISNIIYYNILLGLAVLTKPVLVYFWVPNILFMIYLCIRERRIAVVLYGFIMPTVIFLLTLYNYSMTGCFQYSSNKQVSYLDYGATYLLITVRGEDEGWKKWEEAHNYLDTISNYSFMTDEAERIASEIIMDNKLAYIKFHIKGMLNYFFDPGRYDLNYLLSIKEKNQTGLMYAFAKGGYGEILAFLSRQPGYIIVYLAIVLLMNLVLFLSFLLFFFNKKVFLEIKIFIGFMIFYMSFVSGILGTMRYKIHVYFLLLFTLPFAYEVIKNRFFSSNQSSKK